MLNPSMWATWQSPDSTPLLLVSRRLLDRVGHVYSTGGWASARQVANRRVRSNPGSRPLPCQAWVSVIMIRAIGLVREPTLTGLLGTPL